MNQKPSTVHSSTDSGRTTYGSGRTVIAAALLLGLSTTALAVVTTSTILDIGHPQTPTAKVLRIDGVVSNAEKLTFAKTSSIDGAHGQYTLDNYSGDLHEYDITARRPDGTWFYAKASPTYVKGGTIDNMRVWQGSPSANTIAGAVWAYPTDFGGRTVTGGTVDSVANPVDVSFAGSTTIDHRLSSTHPGNWAAAGGGNVTVLPFQGSASFETVSQGKDIHIVRGDSVAIPYNVGKDITGWSVWFGAKASPADAAYTVPLREVTADITAAASGAGLIRLSTADTGIPPRKYFGEMEIRKGADVSTPLKFNLWVDPDVIR